MSLLDVRELVTGYNRPSEVLRGVSLAVATGEVVGVTGPNGSGKSTLVKAMSRSLRPWQGSVTLGARDIWAMAGREMARQTAVVPQDVFTPFDLTACEVVLLGRHPHVGRLHLEGTADRETARKALAEVNAEELIDRPINDLSGGERQRVLIAKALAQEPKLLLLDEPTAHLDIAHQVEVLARVRQMAREREMGAVAVLHDLNLAAAWCDRVVVLSSGRVAADGAPGEVITEPLVAKVWGARMWVKKHPATGRPFLLPMPPPYEPEEASGEAAEAVHVICGGGSGGPVMAALMREGFRLTCGVLNVGDTDEEVCRAMNIPHVAEAPFSPISEERESANLKLALEADLVVLCDFCIGTGNIANLRTALEAARAGKTVVAAARESSEDYSGGQAAVLLEEILSACDAGEADSSLARRVKAVIDATAASTSR